MKDLAANEYGASRTAGIWKKLSAWAVAAAVIGASPAISAAPPQSVFYPGSPVLSEPYGSHVAITTEDGFRANLEVVRHEISVAQRLLTTFGADFLPEFETYLTTLDAVLSHEITSLSHGERLGFGLRMARVRFEEEASSVKVWARLASCIDQKPVIGRRVPRRFVKVRVRENEAPFGNERSNLWVRKTARDLANGDADPSPRAS
jgi:hypothetical protein